MKLNVNKASLAGLTLHEGDDMTYVTLDPTQKIHIVPFKR